MPNIVKWKNMLSTTEPFNNIGLVKVRQDNTSETWEIRITENGRPYDFSKRKITEVYFNTKFSRDRVVEQRSEIIDVKKGIIQYTMNNHDMQEAKPFQAAYFEFRSADGSYVDSTQTFFYHIIPSKYKECTEGSTYIIRLEELFKLYQDYMSKGIGDWEKFVESNREILESIDPGGKILTELIDGRYSKMLNHTFPTLKDRGDFWDEELANREISLSWFMDPSKTDQENVQKALDSLVPGDKLKFDVPKLSYHEAILKDKTKVELDLGVCEITLTGETPFAIRLEGFIDTVKITGGFINAGESTGGRGISCFSGATITEFHIDKVHIEGVAVGISFNANLGGSVDRCSATHCTLKDIKGTEPGSGYGIHLANGHHIDIMFNTIIGAQRHSIYHARGSFNRIMFNVIEDHRKGVAINSYRPAIAVYRDSENATISYNKITRGYDGAIQVYTDDETGHDDLRYVRVEYNDITNPGNNVASINVGGEGDKYLYAMRHVYVNYNRIVIDVTDIKWAIAALINRGYDGTFIGNSIIYLNVAQRSNAVMIKSPAENKLDNLIVRDNIFDVGGPDTTAFRCFMLDGSLLSDTSNITIKDNFYRNYKKADGIRYLRLDRTGSLTNPNVHFFDTVQQNAKLEGPPASGFHQKGEIVYQSNPNLNAPIGWICVLDGVPGTWHTLGIIGG